MSDSDSGEHTVSEHTMDTDKLVKKRSKKHRDGVNKKKKRKQEDEREAGELDHFFSGLANRNLDHILTKIISYLPGRNVRSCLWTCRALRQAAMSDKEAMSREMITTALKLKFRRKLNPRSVSDKFETDFRDWKEDFVGDEPSGFKTLLAVEARDTADSETVSIMDKIDLKALSSPDFFSSNPANKFGKNWKDKIRRIVGFQDLQCDWLDHGSLVLVEKTEKGAKMTENALVRMDDKEKNGGMIIDKWDYKDIVEDTDLFKEISCSDFYLGSRSSRKENMVFYVYYKRLLYAKDSGKKSPEFLLFALMVDLDEDEILWRKQLGNEDDWDQEKTFITDKFCGFLCYAKGYSSEPKKMRRFKVKTGEEMTSEEPEELFRAKLMELAVSNDDIVAVITEKESYQPHGSPFHFICQTLNADTGSTLRCYELVIPADDNIFVYELSGHYPNNFFRFALFGGRILVMCHSKVNSYDVCNYSARTCFVFWDLEKSRRKVKVSLPCGRIKYNGLHYKTESAGLVMGKVIWLDGFENIGPSLTGNIWYLLKTKVVAFKVESENRPPVENGRVFHTLHTVGLNKSVGGLWNGNLFT